MEESAARQMSLDDSRDLFSSYSNRRKFLIDVNRNNRNCVFNAVRSIAFM